MDLTPVDHDPFVQDEAKKLTPVDFDPFKDTKANASGLTPVDYDPFAKQPAEGPGMLRTAGDVAAQTMGGLVSAGGQIIRSGVTPLGPLPDLAGQAYEAATGTPNPVKTAQRRTAEAFDTAEEAVKGLTSAEGQASQKASTPGGTLWSPSTWSAGTDPSARGYLMHGANLFGQMLPMIASSVAGGGAAASAILGGAMGEGAAKKDARDAITKMEQDGTLLKESEVYRDLIRKGMSPAAAAEKVKQQAEEWAGLLTLPISALGGALTGKIIDPATHILNTRGLVTRMVGRGALGGLEEGTQEVAEGIATRHGTNVGAGTNIPLGEGTFGEFVLGALGGAPVSAAVGSISGEAPNTPVDRQRALKELLKGLETGNLPDDTPRGSPSAPLPGSVRVAEENEDAPVGGLTTEQKGVSSEVQPAPVFYSRLKRFVEEKGENWTADRWLARLKQAGLPQEELDWVGVPEFLKDKDGRVSKADLLAHIEENEVQVGTILRGVSEEGPAPRLSFEKGDGDSWRDITGRYSITEDENGKYQAYYQEENETEPTPLGFPRHTVAGAIYLANLHSRRTLEEPRFGQYFIPGGDNYTEIQLTLPLRMEPAGGLVVKWKDKTGEEFTQYFQMTAEAHDFARGLEEEGARPQIVSDRRPSRDNFTQAEGSHWYEDNTLAHARMDERVDVEGKKVLFVGEVQSDWHQRGRKRGYRGDTVGLAEKILKASEVYKSAKETRRLAEAAFWTKVLNTRSPLLNGTPKSFYSDETIKGFSVNYSPHQFASVMRMEGAMVLELEHLTQAEELENRARWALQDLEDESLGHRGVPNAPFKTSWPELVVKRLLRYAADNGFQRIAFANGDVQKAIYPGMNEKQEAGQREFYDKILPNVVARWAKKLGTQMGSTRFPKGDHGGGEVAPVDGPFAFVEVTEDMASRVKQGLPSFQMNLGDKSVNVASDPGAPADLVAAAQRSGEVLRELAKRFGITKRIDVIVRRGVNGPFGQVTSHDVTSWADVLAGKASHYVVEVFPDKQNTAEEVHSTLMHELGHIVHYEHFAKAPSDVQAAILAEYDTWKRNNPSTKPANEVYASRANFIQRERMLRDVSSQPAMSLSPETFQYLYNFREFMADNVSKWLLTNQKPMSVVDRFFSSLARKIREIHAAFVKKFPSIAPEPSDAFKNWLDTQLTLEQLDYDAARKAAEAESRAANTAGMNAVGTPGFPTTPTQAETVLPRRILKLLGLIDHPGAKSWLAAADRFSWMSKNMLSIVQVAARNLHIAPLQRYRELWQLKQLERSNVMSTSLERLKQWKGLGTKQADALGKVLDDYGNMRYLSPDEVALKVSRLPTDAEIMDMAVKHGLSMEGLEVFDAIRKDFENFLDQIAEVLKADASKITDVNAQARRFIEIDEKVKRLKEVPYVPFMRFGDYTITIYDAAGKVRHFETFESERKRDAAAKEMKSGLNTGEELRVGYLNKEVRPLLGMPSALLDLIAEKLKLTGPQAEALEQLRFELSPAQSFKHRFQRKNYVPGYSEDFQRAYANYFFHGANWLTNVKYYDPLQDQIKEVEDSSKLMPDGTKRGQIAAFMSRHFHDQMDPKDDWATFRAFATLWTLAAVPAAATLNLSQLLVGSYPFLASKFNDGKAMFALSRAGAKLNSYYRRGTLEGATGPELRALSEGIKEGIITEAMAPELAVATHADNLRASAGSISRQVFQWALDKGMWMFQMTEQGNRRITFRAAWNLANENPDAPYVQQAIDKHNLQYIRLLERGWTQREAANFVVAKDVVESTQYIYSQWANPKFMQGRKRTLFMYNNFVQNTLFLTLSNGPGVAVRSWLIMAFLGGMMGVPGAEDLRGILKAIAYRFFGKDFDLEDAARQYIIDLFDEKVPPDLILHGMARRGFGIPALLELTGITNKAPVFDRSKAIGLGQILPVDLGVMFGPQRDQSRAIAESTQRASGAAFGLGFNFYKFLTSGNSGWDDTKRWQLLLPRSLARASQAMRFYSRGEEVNQSGNRVVKFDTSDPQHMAEIIGASMGYQPFRLAAQWDRIIAEREAIQYWNIQRETLLQQAWKARGDSENYNRVLSAIRKFNNTLPDEARGKAITAEGIRRSFMTRARTETAQESGVPRARGDIPLVRSIQRLYPEAEVDVRDTR